MSQVPVIRLAHLSEAQKRALALADNKIALNAGWNPELLAQELQFLSEIDLDLDVTITGFAPAEIDLIIGDAAMEDPKADLLPPLADRDACLVRPGDLWLLGKHRLLCGDATDPAAYRQLMAGKKARLVFSDPPYNVPIDGHVCGSGSIRHREFAMASGEMTPAAFTAFLEASFANLARHSVDGAVHFICMDWRHLREALAAGDAVYAQLLNLCVWAKSNGGMGSFYRSRHELVLVFKHGTAPHMNTIELGRHGRYRTNVWDYPGINSLGAERSELLRLHPTVKPVALVADAILDASTRGDIVLDAFAGSGTILIAAERTGRIAHALEIDPVYVETAIRRWEAYTGEAARHAPTGLTWEEIAAYNPAEAHPSALDIFYATATEPADAR
jgi:DNA modification methylase